MYRSRPLRSRRHYPATVMLVGLTLLGLLGLPLNVAAQGSPPAPTMAAEEVAHPFLTHMGVPEGVGVFSLRASGLVTRADSKTEGDFGFHFETGLTKTIGLHIRNDAFRTNSHTEAMFQFVAIMSKDGMSGFAPLIEFEFPTKSGAGSRIESLIGFTTALANSQIALNQVIHYNPREDAVDGSAALVARVAERFFPVAEILGEGGTGAPTVVTLLAGLKVQVREGITLGFALQFPVSGSRDFSSRMVLQPEFEWGKK
ncbi:MAG: hypothetical protein SGJ01_16850 [Gemmatimonadota bacterium]|nr:hypothetical protein [Gemmatimonadota bacterium]